ncbi:MAG: HAD superfamily hydrolase (TIGR01509 family) [Halioglobus sp.]|jgi:HAD superfamily hydrolase (TIGR01509 family)
MRKFILWDNDGVLVDTEQWYFTATQRALAQLNISLKKSDYLQIMAQGKSSWDMAAAAGVSDQVAQKKREERDQYYQQYLVEKDIEIPGVLEVLKVLADSYRMAIVTTSKRAPFELIHQHRGILPMMEFVLAREDYEHSKPDPEPYLMALDRLGAKADEAVVIEDSQRGLRSAIAAGIDCVVVYNNFTVTHDFTGATRLIQSLDELPGVLESL